jgi:hypothetical protein
MSEAVQLIQKSPLKDALWLTFWKLKQKRRFAVEVRLPVQLSYDIGSVYLFDREAHDEKSCFLPLTALDSELVELLLIPVAQQPFSPGPSPKVEIEVGPDVRSSRQPGGVRMVGAF